MVEGARRMNWMGALLFFISGPVAAESIIAPSVHLDTGSALQLIIPVSSDEGREIRSQYYETAIPLARSYGFAEGVRLEVVERLRGTLDASTFVIAQWTDAGQWDAFKADPAWPELKKLRQAGWQELSLYTQTITSPLTLSFKPDKHYTLAFAWLNPSQSKDYFRYLEKIEYALHDVGGRFVYKMIYPDAQSHADRAAGPGQITLVEWDTEDGVERLLLHPDYTPHTHYLASGISDFAFFRVKPSP